MFYLWILYGFLSLMDFFDVILDFILLRACLDGRRGEFVGFELYECSGKGWISSQSPIVIDYYY